MDREFTIPLFGDTREATLEELRIIQELVDEVPVAVFQAFNKKLNKKGICFTINIMEGGETDENGE